MSIPPIWEAGRPAYLQIAQWISQRIGAGELAVGDKLPSERGLSIQTGAARGTVQAAYRELKRQGLIQITPGSGVYVCQRPKPVGYEAALAAVEQLCGAGLGREEIQRLAQDCAWRRLPQGERPRLAWVDCCSEMLRPVQREIEVACGFSVEPILLSQLQENPELLQREQFQAIATSIEHHEQVMSAASPVLLRIAGRVERVVISLTQQSAQGLSAIQAGEVCGIFCQCEEFFVIARRHLLQASPQALPVAMELSRPQPEAQTGHLHWAILPPERDYGDGACGAAADVLRTQGCRVIHLRHQIDTPSLAYLQRVARSFD